MIFVVLSQFHRGCIDEWLFASHTTCPVDHQPILPPNTGRFRRTLHQPGQGSAGRGRVVGSLVRVRPQRGVIGRSHGRHQSSQDLNFGVEGQRIVNEDSGITQPMVRHCDTLGATPTNSRTGANMNSILKSTAIGRPRLLQPHPPMEPHVSLEPIPSLMAGGQKSYLGLGAVSQKSAPIGRLRKGCIAPRGGDNWRNKVWWQREGRESGHVWEKWRGRH